MEHLTFTRLGRGPGHALDARPRSLFTSSGRDGDVRVPPDTAWEEVEEKVGSNRKGFCQSITRGSVEIEKINKAKRDFFKISILSSKEKK